MTDVPTYEPERCPLTAALRVVGGKWRGLLWWRLSLGMGRFVELQRSVPQMSRKVLADELRSLVAEGLVERREVEGAAAHVEYSLTSYGASLGPVFEALASWGEGHLARRGTQT